MKFGAIIVGAGKGERLGSSIPKCLIKVDSVSLIVMSAWAFESVKTIDSISLVVPSGYEAEIQAQANKVGLNKVISVVAGGLRRQDSVNNGLAVLPSNIGKVLIHDGARSLVSAKLIENVVDELKVCDAVTAAVPIGNTLHFNENGCAVRGVDRAGLWGAQTPQGFNRELLLEAFLRTEQDNISVTDEVTLVRDTMGVNALLVQGEACNIKITHPDDLEFYRPHLEARVKQINGLSV